MWRTPFEHGTAVLLFFASVAVWITVFARYPAARLPLLLLPLAVVIFFAVMERRHRWK